MAACSRKKDSFLSRNAHAVKAEFNALYNGQVAFEDGLESISQNFKDNFWKILPVERIELGNDGNLPGEKKNENFTRSEEKAAKAIQTHSMYIGGKEYNPQVDEAYLLLGKSRYFDNRFIPAVDAFNFILDKYPTSNNINTAKVWKAKTNIRLKNEDVALENLMELFEDGDLSDEDFADASAIMAQAYISLDSLPQALPYIKQASEAVKDKELKGRYTYIKGQIYNELGHKDSANIAFDEVIDMNRKSPRSYMINAYISKAKNFDYDKEDKMAFLELLTDLEEDRENRPFLDKIYYQLGEYYRSINSIDTSVTYYNKSIQSYQNDRTLQALNYKTLAEINFDKAEYKNAGAYYDSTLTQLEEGTREFRRVTKKRENLDDVITYEDIATRNDSILRIVNMSEGDRLAYFIKYTRELKEKAVADSIAAVKAEESIANKEFFKKNGSGGNDDNGNRPGKFYFYNPTTVAYGKQEFFKVWGKRELEDNWRLSNKQSKLKDIEAEGVEVIPIAENELYKPESYIARIPTEAKEIDSIGKDRNFAYYQLGLIYKEKFKEYELAASRLEKLLTYQPEERLILPSIYNLYKIYDQLGNSGLATKYKNEIIANHPDSRYAEILLNPNTQLATDESSPEFKYKALYADFEANKHQQVIDQCEAYITQYNGNDIVPKFELLKATALGKQNGYEDYKKALNYVSLNYPNSEEGKEAQDIYDKLLPKLAFKTFEDDKSSTRWKVIYSFSNTDKEAANELENTLKEAITFFTYSSMSTSIDYYNSDTIFVVIHGLNTRLGGNGFAEVLKEDKKYRIQNSHFEISSPNYRIIQIHKNMDEYLKADLSVKEKETEIQK